MQEPCEAELVLIKPTSVLLHYFVALFKNLIEVILALSARIEESFDRSASVLARLLLF